MTLMQAIIAAGMTPPQEIYPGKWLRFPGMGKGRSNRSGWCRMIGPTLAIYGDWSTGLHEIWRDESHRDDEQSKRDLKEAQAREKRFAAEQRARQNLAATRAQQLIRQASIANHPYLARKGFPQRGGLVFEGKLLIPVRDSRNYAHIISVQEIDEQGEKRFLAGSRTRAGVHHLGAPLAMAKRIVLCEGYATGLTLDAALSRLPGPHAVVVCFSARNLEIVAEESPKAFIAADHDASKTGELSAIRSGLKWVMPANEGEDFNDVHVRQGIPAVTEILRGIFH